MTTMNFGPGDGDIVAGYEKKVIGTLLLPPKDMSGSEQRGWQ